MEDRMTSGLYVETSDATPSSFETRRVPELLALDGLERVTWWENVNVGRSDLPRRLAEFTLLGVCELTDGFRAPAPAADGSSGYHFRRYPRPGQGHLSAQPTVGLSLVLISPRTPEAAQALRDWGDFVHIRHIAACGVPGFTMITPYENVTGGEPRFMHFYEMDTEDPEAAFRSMPKFVEQRIGAMGSPEWKAWAGHEALVIDYVNSFRLLGAASR
jgi:hypothetical protein